MAGGLSFLGRGADDTALSPAMQAWLQQQAQDVPAAVPPGFTGYAAPTAPAAADADRVLTPTGQNPLPFLGSVARGTMSGATEAGQGLLRSAVSGFTLPRDVYQGKVDLGSDEAIGRTMDLAGLMAGGSVPAPVPEGALRIFGGKSAATADHAALEQAQGLAASGADRRAIWDRTGWFQGADDMWRFEIPDSAAKLTPERQGDKFFGVGPAATVLQHEPLYSAYPALAGEQVIARGAPGVEASGAYNDFGRTRAYGPTEAEAQSVLLHEMQHGIQAREGFAMGGNPADPSFSKYPSVIRARAANPDNPNAAYAALQDIYQRQAGEVEARNVQARRDFTPEQRRTIPPWETQDVPDELQIVRFAPGSQSYSLPFLGRDR